MECPANWLIHYDEKHRIKGRNEWTDAGNLVHGALEIFRDPQNEYDQSSFAVLEEIFRQVCRKSKFAENLKVYARAYELLGFAFRMGLSHPSLPMERVQTISVEQELLEINERPWQLPAWPLPMKGFIDRVGIIERMKGDGYSLFIEDYKTGWPKSLEEILEESIQAPTYFLYAEDVLREYLDIQGYPIVDVLGSFSYIGHGTSVPLATSDFDHLATIDYVRNISYQMIDAKEAFIEASNYVPQDEMNEWLFVQGYEKLNPYCGRCPRKSSCKTFHTMLKHGKTIDISTADWGALWQEHETFAAIAKSSKQHVDDINDLIKAHLDYEKLEGIPLPGTEQKITANRQKIKKYKTSAVREVFGDDFIFRNTDISDTAVKRELTAIAKKSPKRAREIEALLPTLYSVVPGAQPVRLQKNVEKQPKKAFFGGKNAEQKTSRASQ